MSQTSPMDRRSALKFGLAGTLSLFSGTAFGAVSVSRSLSFLNLHTGESATATYWENGQYISEATRTLDYLLRDHRTNEVREIDRGILDQLYRLRLLVGNDRPFHVISGYRSARTNAMLARRSGGVARRSYHQFGMAIDVRLPGTRLQDLRNAALSMKAGGVGYYRRSNFIHLDTGRVRFW